MPRKGVERRTVAEEAPVSAWPLASAACGTGGDRMSCSITTNRFRLPWNISQHVNLFGALRENLHFYRKYAVERRSKNI